MTNIGSLTASRRGAWIINVAKHLAAIDPSNVGLSVVENIAFAGQCGSLLIALSSDLQEERVSLSRAKAMARPIGISGPQLRLYLDSLKMHSCIDFDPKRENIEVLSFTRTRVLDTTARILEASLASDVEKVIPDFLEYCLKRPRTKTECLRFLVSNKLSEKNAEKMMGLVHDLELLGRCSIDGSSGEELFFNGYQFGDTAKNFGNALKALSQKDAETLDELIEAVSKQPAISHESLKCPDHIIKMALGFGLIEASEVASDVGSATFYTLPRFAPPTISGDEALLEQDVFHHAKSLLSAFKFGQLKSTVQRGQIRSPLVLVSALLDRDCVGPCAAIGQDYGILEANGVISTQEAKNRSGNYFMILRRKEPVELVKTILESANLQRENTDNPFDKISSLPTVYKGPELKRTQNLKNVNKEAMANWMSLLRS